MSIEKKCIECAVIIVDEWFLACKGFMCDKVISYTCASSQANKLIAKHPKEVRNAMKLIFNGLPGLSWFCPECTINMKQLYCKLDTTAKTIVKTKETLNETVHALTQAPKVDERRTTRSQSKAQLLDQPNSPTKVEQTKSRQTPPTPPTVATPQTITSVEAILPTSHVECITVPVSKPPQDVGGMIVENSITINGNKNTKQSGQDNYDTISIVKPRRWLFISRIDPSVTDVQFKGYINNTFNLKDINAIRMTPKPRNGAIYNYISYRLSVDDDAFYTLLKSKLWPLGIFIKEFEFSQKKSYFRTTGAVNLIT